MTRTEERLADALHAAAETVQRATLRPLTTHDPERLRGADRHRTRHLRWLAPAAAAAGVAAVIVGSVLVARTIGPVRQPSGLGPSPPRFYLLVAMNASGYSFQLRDTRTGNLLATLPTKMPHGWSASSTTPYVSAAADGRTFFLVSSRGAGSQGTTDVCKDIATTFYRLSVSASGRITAFVPVGKQSRGLAGPIAASPDGRMIAYAAARCNEAGPWHLDQVVVQDLATGASRAWTGTKGITNIQRLTWTRDGRTLGVEYGQPDGTGLVAVRAVDVTKPGGSLQDSRLVYSQRHCCRYQAVLSPDGRSVVAVTLRSLGTQGYQQQVLQIPLAGGPPRLLYQGRRSATGPDPSLFSDASGRHWILISGDKFGWLSGGRLVPLASSPLPPKYVE